MISDHKKTRPRYHRYPYRVLITHQCGQPVLCPCYARTTPMSSVGPHNTLQLGTDFSTMEAPHLTDHLTLTLNLLCRSTSRQWRPSYIEFLPHSVSLVDHVIDCNYKQVITIDNVPYTTQRCVLPDGRWNSEICLTKMTKQMKLRQEWTNVESPSFFLSRLKLTDIALYITTHFKFQIRMSSYYKNWSLL